VPANDGLKGFEKHLNQIDVPKDKAGALKKLIMDYWGFGL
jgi:hypothetical protein